MTLHCGLMIHITDTRKQKVVGYKSAHITETVFARDQQWEEQSSLYLPQLYCHSQEHRKWISIQQKWPESLFQTPLLFQNFLIRVRLFFNFENPTPVQTPATII